MIFFIKFETVNIQIYFISYHKLQQNQSKNILISSITIVKLYIQQLQLQNVQTKMNFNNKKNKKQQLQQFKNLQKIAKKTQIQLLNQKIQNQLLQAIQKNTQNDNNDTTIKTQVQVKVQIQTKPKSIQQNQQENYSNPQVNDQLKSKITLKQENQTDKKVPKNIQKQKAQGKPKLFKNPNKAQHNQIINKSGNKNKIDLNKKQMKSQKTQENKKDIKINLQISNEQQDSSGVYKSEQFQDLEDTTQLKIEKNQQKNQSKQKHYIIPGTMFQGQFQYVTKQKKQQDVQKQLKQLQNQKHKLQISTQHYVNPTTIVQGQIQKAGKQHKKDQIEKQIRQKQQEKEKEQNINTEKVSQKPKVLHRVNLHQFNSNQVPQLHQQDIPLNLQPVKTNQNLLSGLEDKTIHSIKPLKPVEIKQQKEQVSSLQPQKLTLNFNDKQRETTNKKDQTKKQKDQQRHYVIPGTMFEGQFEYVTKQKKEQDVQKQLQQLENEKRQIQISTEHYVNPTTIVQGQVQKCQKRQKQQIIQKQIQKIQNKKQKQLNKKIQEEKQPDNSSKRRESSSQDTQKLKLLKQNSKDKKSIKLSIASDQGQNLPFRIDQTTTMTVISQNQSKRPSITLQQSQQPNDDIQIMVLQTRMNNQATSSQDLISQNPRNVVQSNKLPSMLDDLINKNGQPLKVVIGTKQFANYPGQLSPSPPIINEIRLKELRQKNTDQNQVNNKLQQRLQQNTQNNEVQSFAMTTKYSQGGNPQQMQMNSTNIKQKTSEVMQGNQKVEFEQVQITMNSERIRRMKQDEPRKRSFLGKLARSAIFSSIVGGIAWLNLQDKKITAISAASGFAIALLIQK